MGLSSIVIINNASEVYCQGIDRKYFIIASPNREIIYRYRNMQKYDIGFFFFFWEICKYEAKKSKMKTWKN